ncbi:vitamin K epoxide reductase family protein [Kocuria sp. JC486]|uniref:vitamin K epoxide reductase family protein n=1 Tax=Kocuria sp. JC486 TaxID=1970736 RepID=UPI00141DEE29|nr:vitamin K epoxide reductase family protein [Kocuria sp. JC486]NHU84205.1 vitamin K epoxide reductase family protein [Kocuria sp. JC486]
MTKATENHNQAALDESDPTSRLPRGDASWALLAVITAGLALYASISLVIEKWAILQDPLHVTACDINAAFSCGTVIRSSQANLFGFPNPFIGLVAYTLVIVMAVGVLAGARYKAWMWMGLLVGLVLGEVFLLWLWTQATFSINALCLYCMLVWFVHPVLLMATVARCVRTRALPAPEALRDTTKIWAPAGVILIWLVVFGTVLVRFSGTMFG